MQSIEEREVSGVKAISNKRAKACAIPAKVKRKVAQRDQIDGWTCCVLCGSPKGLPEAHYISRADGGLGIEQNIVTLCRRCHDVFDNGTREQRREFGEQIKGYLMAIYPDWDEDKLIYKR